MTFSLLSDIITSYRDQGLSDVKEKAVQELLTRQIEVYSTHHKVSTANGVSGLVEHIQKTYQLALQSVDVG